MDTATKLNTGQISKRRDILRNALSTEECKTLLCADWYCCTGAAAEAECEEGSVRLAGGLDEMSGRVEVCGGGVWGTVCDHGFGQTEAKVVCHQLGFDKCESTFSYCQRCVATIGCLFFQRGQFYKSRCLDPERDRYSWTT